MMMDKQMSMLGSRRFRVNDFYGRTIKIHFWKNGQEPRGMMFSYDGNDIEIQRRAPLSIRA